MERTCRNIIYLFMALISLALLLVSHLGWLLLPDSAVWQATARGIVATLF